MRAAAPRVTALQLHRKSRVLDVTFADASRFELPCEYLRVFSPSAELRGHGLPEPMLVGGKRTVGIARIDPVGQYAVRLVFDDGHDTGLYSWEGLHELALGFQRNWARYLERLTEAGMTRDSDIVSLKALVGQYTPPRR